MLEEFAVSLVGGRIIASPSLERLLSPSMPPQLQDEAPAVLGPQMEDVDPAGVSYELRTPPTFPIQWAVDSLMTHRAQLPARLRTSCHGGWWPSKFTADGYPLGSGQRRLHQTPPR
jgi:hypothetical protein